MSEPTISKEMIRQILTDQDGTKHRFNMSGYDTKDVGDCTIHNQAILNRFAFLGLYDYTTYLFLDFYKGTPTLYYQYFYPDSPHEVYGDGDLNGLTTSEIILEVLKRTVYSGKETRRRG